jgi:phage gpG-like protein
MESIEKQVKSIFGNILNDIRVQLGDEFDQNFERQSFFGEAWARHKTPGLSGKTILVDSGRLRNSIQSKTTDSSITFFSDLEYAAIHNEGGDIVVTAKMKRYFWAKYYETSEAFGRKKNGQKRQDKRNTGLNEISEFYMAMALMRVGDVIKIPRRTFIGYSKVVEDMVVKLIETNLTDYFDNEFKLDLK